MRLAEVEQELSSLSQRHTRLWTTYERLKEELALLQRRIVIMASKARFA